MTTFFLLSDLKALVALHQSKQQRVGLTAVDPNAFGIDFLSHLKECKESADKLVVLLQQEGNGKQTNLTPLITFFSSIEDIDFIFIPQTAMTLDEVFITAGFDLFFPWSANVCDSLSMEANSAELGCQEYSITRQYTPSSKKQFELKFKRRLSSEAFSYFQHFRRCYSEKDIHDTLDAMGKLKVAVVGDTILDEYCYCKPLGVSSKDPVVSLQFLRKDLFAGGVLAVANTVANFAAEVGLFSVLGGLNSQEVFVRNHLHENIRPTFFTQDNAPTLVKRRYLEGYSLTKLIEIYHMDDSGLHREKDAAFQELLARELSNYDLVIAADFGHGAISPGMRETLVRYAPFLSVNTQANSGNRGYHSITCYSHADFVSIAEHEIRLEMRDDKGPIEPMLESLISRVGAEKFVVTRGSRGCLIKERQDGFVEVPAFANRIVDRIGAGDAFFSIASLAAYLKTPPELLGFLGNVVGALAVEVMGNERPIDKQSTKDFISNLLC